jgi:hypothetical protein
MKTIASIILLNLVLTITGQTINQFTTNPDSQGFGYIIYLDRHFVNCPQNQVLNGFKIIRPSELLIAVSYSCIEVVPLPLQVEIHKSPETLTYNNEKEMNYSADRLRFTPVQCPDEMALKGFQLITQCNSWGAECVIKFDFDCTPMKFISCASSQTDPIDVVNGELFTLMKVPIIGTAGSALTGFNLFVSYYPRVNNFNGRIFTMKYNYCNVRDIKTEIANYIRNKPKITKLRMLDNPEENTNEFDDLASKATISSF